MDRKKISSLALITTFLLSGSALAISIPNTSSNPKTFLGPSLALSVTKGVSENTAFSIGGEGGPKLMRVNGTIGWEWTYYQRIKATAEFLRQKLTYSFFDGRASEWMSQGALGLAYQYNFHDTLPYNTTLDLLGYVSHAPSRNLGTSSGTFIDSTGTPQDYLFQRRIAGSNAAGISPGVTISPTSRTSLGFLVNYDSVRYDTVNNNGGDAKGLGGTVFLNQALNDDVTLGLSGAVRAPFNDYQGYVAWGNVPYYGTWIFRVYGAYTIGKHSLPTTYNVGLGADYLIDTQPVLVAAPLPILHGYKDQPVYKDMPIYKDMVPPAEWDDVDVINKSLVRWTAIPAVKIPTVLTKTDGRLIIQQCVPPTLVNPFPSVFCGAFNYDLNGHFSGSDLTYTVIIEGPPGVNPNDLTVQGSYLVGTGTYPPIGEIQFRIRASNACGSVETTDISEALESSMCS
jgi:hypothetical protein